MSEGTVSVGLVSDNLVSEGLVSEYLRLVDDRAYRRARKLTAEGASVLARVMMVKPCPFTCLPLALRMTARLLYASRFSQSVLVLADGLVQSASGRVYLPGFSEALADVKEALYSKAAFEDAVRDLCDSVLRKIDRLDFTNDTSNDTFRSSHRMMLLGVKELDAKTLELAGVTGIPPCPVSGLPPIPADPDTARAVAESRSARHLCAHQGCTAPLLLRKHRKCSVCGTSYCGEECNRKDWHFHRRWCKKLVK